jgi:hypothetical protein
LFLIDPGARHRNDPLTRIVDLCERFKVNESLRARTIVLRITRAR